MDKFTCAGCLDRTHDPAAKGWEPDIAGQSHEDCKEDEWLCFICLSELKHDPDTLLPVWSYTEEIVRWAETEGESIRNHPKLNTEEANNA